MKTIHGFTIENLGASKDSPNGTLRITAPDGSYRLRKRGEEYTIYCAFSDEACDLLDAMSADAFAEWKAAIATA